jgi:hypothetical protein
MPGISATPTSAKVGTGVGTGPSSPASICLRQS